MDCSILIATFGGSEWEALARKRAYPSALAQGACEVLLKHAPDGTLASVRNALADEAKGAFICYVDADDELERGYLTAMKDAWTAGVITTDWSPLLVPAVRYVRRGEWVRTESGPRSTSDHIGTAAIPNRGRWPATNECVIGTLVRADLFRTVGGFRDHTNDGTELTMYEDYDLSLRCYDAGAQLVYVEDAVYRAYVNPSGRNSIHSESVYQAIWADHLARAS